MVGALHGSAKEGGLSIGVEDGAPLVRRNLSIAGSLAGIEVVVLPNDHRLGGRWGNFNNNDL